MSNEAKKPGARDISDLKARLGLKKGGETGSRTAAPGVVPPPGAARLTGAYVPPPPGVAPPPGAPQPPAIPDATVDPFGAMNAMAAQGAVRAQPEIIVVNDGKGVEQVNKKSSVVGLLKMVAMVAIPLVVGFIIGGINYERKQVGVTIRDAGFLRDEFNAVGKKLQDLTNTLYIAKGETGGKGFKVGDQKLITDLEAVDLGIPEGDDKNFLIYHAHLYTMDPKLIGDTLAFYSGIKQLQDRIREFAKRHKNNAALTKDPVYKKVGAMAAVLRQPPARGSEPPPPPVVEIVQLGAPVCDDAGTVSTTGQCPGPVKGFQFRNDSGQGFGTMAIAAPGLVEANKIYNLGDTGVLSTVLMGSERTFEEVDYTNRITEIDSLTENLMLLRKDIENKMNTLAQRPKPFAI